MKQIIEYIKAFLLLLAVTIVSGIVVMKVAMYTGGEAVNAPDVRGKEIIPALKELNAKGLNLKITRMENNPTVPKDRIISQDPVPGEPVKTGRSVRVVISRGSQETIMPDITGASLIRAETMLDGGDIRIGKKIYIHSNRLRDVILAQRPEPGSFVKRGETLSLLVSSGPPPERIMTPDFTGEPVSMAMERLKELGLRIRRVLYRPGEGKERGVVIEQDPPFGSRIDKGSYVTLTISEGEASKGEGPATYTILYYTVPDLPSAVKVTIMQENRDGEKEVYNRVHRPGDTLSLLVEIKGETAAKVFLDNELAEVRRF